LLEGGAYSKYLAYGVGDVQSDPLRLGNFSGVVELVTESHNFDPTNGTLFIRKKWILDENDKNGYEFVEVGLTPYPDAENPKIANRFLVNGGEPIYRDAGEEMTFEITIYLEFEGESNLKLTAGSNALVKFLLGDGKDGDFYVARGYDTTANDMLIERSAVGLEKVLSIPEVVIEDNPPRLSFVFSGQLSPGEILEFLLIIGDEVVARQNVKEVYGGSNDVKIELVGDADNYVTLTTPNIQSISSLTNLTTGESVPDFVTKNYGTSFYGGVDEIFSGLGYQNAEKVFISKQQDKIAFIKDGKLKVYFIEESGPVELDTSNIDVTDGYLYLLFDDMFFVKCAHADGTYSIRYYHRDSKGVYVQKSYYLENPNYETTGPDGEWYDMDGLTMSADDDNRFMLVMATPKYIFGYKVRKSNSFVLYSVGVVFIGGYIVDFAKTMEGTNKLSNCIISYDQNKGRMSYRKNNVFQTTYDTDAINIVTNYRDQGYPKAAKNYAFAVDNNDKSIKLFSIDTLLPYTMTFEGADKIFVDDRLDYAVVRYPSGEYRVFYIDASRNLYAFQNPVPELGSEIEKMFVVGNYFVFLLADGRIVRLGINKNKVALASIPSGNTAEVTLRADVTPGQDGKPIGYTANMNVSAENESGGES